MNANELIENARKIIGKPLGELRAFQLLPQIQLSADMLRQQQAEIEALKAELNIANLKWESAENNFIDVLVKMADNTVPAKTLTYEDINAIVDQFKEGEHWKSDVKWVIPESDFIDFADEILKKGTREMNANELADAIEENKEDMECSPVYLGEALYMLRTIPKLEDIIIEAKFDIERKDVLIRQQHAEIEALKAENKFFKDLMGDVEILRKVQEK